MHVKMTLTFPKETIDELKRKANSEGFLSPNLLARHLIVSGLKRLEKGTQGVDEFMDLLFAKARNLREGNKK
jgi:hypothetical protein